MKIQLLRQLPVLINYYDIWRIQNMAGIDLSVCIPVYNHGKYLSKTLDSVLAQNINFNIEVLVGDDASTDDSAFVMREYEVKYPGFFTMIYRKKNTYQDKEAVPNGRDLLYRAKGRYIITLEGDDFWIDTDKLQTQFDFLENNPDYIAVAHNVIVVDENNQETGFLYPECKDEEYTIWHYLKGILPGQTATIMCKNYVDKSNNMDNSLLEKKLSPGDQLKIFVLLSYGKIFCIQRKMSAYRNVTNHGSSFSATYRYDFQKALNYSRERMLYALNNEHVPKMNVVVAERLYFRTLVNGLKHNDLNVSYIIKETIGLRYKLSCLVSYFKH